MPRELALTIAQGDFLEFYPFFLQGLSSYEYDFAVAAGSLVSLQHLVGKDVLFKIWTIFFKIKHHYHPLAQYLSNGFAISSKQQHMKPLPGDVDLVSTSDRSHDGPRGRKERICLVCLGKELGAT